MTLAFPLGRVVISQNALCSLPHYEIVAALRRHSVADWGELDEEDRVANNEALKHGDRLLSVYKTGAGTKFWIITEWDRSATTIVLPEDY
jgi:hypothetical protein